MRELPQQGPLQERTSASSLYLLDRLTESCLTASVRALEQARTAVAQTHPSHAVAERSNCF